MYIIEKFPAKSIVAFRNKKGPSKLTFINKLKKAKPAIKQDGSGGDYWISTTSCLSNVIKLDNKGLLDEKITFLAEKKKKETRENVQNRHQQNIDLITNIRDFDFTVLKPATKINILKQSTANYIIDIGGLPIYIKPDMVFTFTNNDFTEVGAVWFVAQKLGFNRIDLAVIVELLFIYLTKHYGESYKISNKYCSVVDVYKRQTVSYGEIATGAVRSLLNETLKEIKQLL